MVVDQDTRERIIETLQWMIKSFKYECDSAEEAVQFSNSEFKGPNPYAREIQSGDYSQDLKAADNLLTELRGH